MSTLSVSNITDGTTTLGTEYVVNGAAKAFIHYTDDTFAVLKSFNVSSQTDNGNGDISYTLTNAMDDADYAAIGEGGGDLSTSYNRIPTHWGSTSTVVRMRCTNSGSYSTQQAYRGCSAIFGDLA